MSDRIHQEIVLPVPPSRVYEALTDAAQFSKVTAGAPAKISADEGGAFSCFGDRIVGRHVELVPQRRIVQAWRAANWDEGIYSVVRFELQEDADSTRLVFDQSGFPEGEKNHLEEGWPKMYWEPLQKFFA